MPPSSSPSDIETVCDLFSPLDGGLRARRSLYVSILLHAAFFAWLLFPVAPTYIKPHLLMAGEHGASMSHVFWLAPPAKSDLLARTQSTRLAWRKPSRQARPQPAKVAKEEQQPASSPNPAPLAGLPGGSLDYGPVDGFEVRPAIRVSGSEPLVAASDLAGVSEGNIIIEVTIDERGNIVRKVVLQSLAPAVDNKVMAALEDWHFLPATRDGIAIPSKQDVHYHYPVRR